MVLVKGNRMKLITRLKDVYDLNLPEDKVQGVLSIIATEMVHELLSRPIFVDIIRDEGVDVEYSTNGVGVTLSEDKTLTLFPFISAEGESNIDIKSWKESFEVSRRKVPESLKTYMNQEWLEFCIPKGYDDRKDHYSNLLEVLGEGRSVKKDGLEVILAYLIVGDVKLKDIVFMTGQHDPGCTIVNGVGLKRHGHELVIYVDCPFDYRDLIGHRQVLSGTKYEGMGIRRLINGHLLNQGDIRIMHTEYSKTIV